MMRPQLLILVVCLLGALNATPKLPLSFGGQFEVFTRQGDPHYAIAPFISGYYKGIGHVKIGALVEKYDQVDANGAIFATERKRIFGQVGIDLVMIGGGSYIYYKLSNQKLLVDNTLGDSDWILNHSIGIGAQHMLNPFLGLTAELEYAWDKALINSQAPQSEPLSQSGVQMNLGILFYIY
ncbi:MAG: hypothetical protein OCD01_18080 [Fibrobacterales bacterium]